MKEWPLVVFTLATQLACGLTIAATLFDVTSPADASMMAPLAVWIFPILAVGILSSFAHLGRPRLAWRAIVNVRQSRFSREVALTALFAVLSLIYSAFWWTGTSGGRLLLGVAAGAAGIAAVISAALLYMLPAQPAWNSGWLPASFLGTTLLLGGLTPAILIPWPAHTVLLRLFLSAVLAGSVLLLFAVLWMLKTRPPASRSLFWLGCYVTLVGALPVALVIRLGVAPAPFALIALMLVIAGTAVGRAITYSLSVEPF